MEFEVPHRFENEQQFWTGKGKKGSTKTLPARLLTMGTGLEEIVSRDYQDSSLIDNALRAYLTVTNESRGIPNTTNSELSVRGS